MSDIILNQLGQHYAEDMVTKFIEKYNKESSDLTEKGRREMLTNMVFFAFLKGANIYKKGFDDEKTSPVPSVP